MPQQVEQPLPGPMVPTPFAVTAKRQETADTWTLELSAPGGAGMSFAPGQFTMISAFGAGEVPISISGDPDGDGTLVHTVREVGLATAAICRAGPGETLEVRGPFGRPWPVAELEGSDVVVVAGGIGLAPLRPAILALLARRERYGRLLLLYGGRSPEQLLYTDELERWSAGGLDVAVSVDSAGPEWLGHVGVVTRLVARASFDTGRAAAFVCGPEVMMRFAVNALAQAGVPDTSVYASMERNMQCGIAHCGHCQLGPTLVCRDGPVYRWSELASWLRIREL
ncbi:MAG TPA: FAD/NAD(P)-binding protein [Solirubrobacteraceae bacterium]|nr:FAD/NAD(P)-binding protein [Solirubrobacteraceae bacterium]